MIQACAYMAICILDQLTSMDCNSKPHAVRRRFVTVADSQVSGDASSQRMQQACGGDLGANEQPQTIPRVDACGEGQIDPGAGERLVDKVIEAATELFPNRIGPLGAAEALDVDSENPTIDGLIPHLWRLGPEATSSHSIWYLARCWNALRAIGEPARTHVEPWSTAPPRSPAPRPGYPGCDLTQPRSSRSRTRSPSVTRRSHCDTRSADEHFW